MNRNTTLKFVLRALDAFIAREGHACVPAAHIEDGLRLGEAVEHLRKLRADAALPGPVVQAIQSKPGWYWAPGETLMHRFIAVVGRCISMNAHASFDPGSRAAELADQVRAQLDAGTLDRDTFLAFHSFPLWQWESGADRGWADRFREMLALSEQQGNCRVSAERGHAQLTAWVTGQRSKFRAGDLEASRQRRLEMLTGWEWDPAAGRRERYLTELVAYIEEHGSAEVPKSYVTEDGFALGATLNRLRRQHVRGELSAERVAALDAIPGWEWSSRPPQEEFARKGLAALKSYVAREGHARVPFKHVEDGFRLGEHLNGARDRLKRCQLSAARLTELDAVHVGWRRGVQVPAAYEAESDQQETIAA